MTVYKKKHLIPSRAYPTRNERIFPPLSEISSVDSEEGHTLFPILPKVTKM